MLTSRRPGTINTPHVVCTYEHLQTNRSSIMQARLFSYVCHFDARNLWTLCFRVGRRKKPLSDSSQSGRGSVCADETNNQNIAASGRLTVELRLLFHALSVDVPVIFEPIPAPRARSDRSTKYCFCHVRGNETFCRRHTQGSEKDEFRLVCHVIVKLSVCAFLDTAVRCNPAHFACASKTTQFFSRATTHTSHAHMQLPRLGQCVHRHPSSLVQAAKESKTRRY